jgi:cysteine desulfurase
VITSNAEHKCVLEVCARAERLGHEVTILPVDRFGQVSAAQVKAALRPNTSLVTLIHGNNEIGSLNPLAAIGEVLQRQSRGHEREGGDAIVFHVDAAQTLGKVPVNVRAMGIGLLSMSAHKFYGPKGVGALFVRRAEGERVHLRPFMTGGGQERGLRGGTHNVPGIVGLGRAAELCEELMAEESVRLTQLRDRLIRGVCEGLGSERVDLNGHPTARLPNNVNLTLHGVESGALLMGLREIAFSSSSACSSGTASHVLKAIGQKVDDPRSATLRLGLGRSTTDADIDFTITRILETARQM